MSELAELDPEFATRILTLAETITQADGVAAFGAAALADLRRPVPRDSYAVLMADDEPIAAAWCDGSSAEFGVHPEYRQRGYGKLLLQAVHERYPDAAVWAHGNLPGATAVVDSAGLRPVRELWFMDCDLTGIEDWQEHDPAAVAEALAPPSGMIIRGFKPGDETDWVATNAAAFTKHPEQSQIDEVTFAEFRAEKWWQPHLLRIVEVLEPAPGTARIAGFIWLKPEKPGVMEIFVVGVHPHYQGRGIGGLLLREAIATAVNLGATRAILYVDGADKIAIHTYQRQGFIHRSTDIQYVGANRQG